MGRRPNPQRKRDLLDEIVVYLGENGIGDLSLRPLAKQLGTSTYTLTYQFGSKDQLLSDSVRHAVAMQLEAVAGLGGEPVAPAEAVRRVWAWTVDPANLRLVRMLLEATTLAASQPELFGGVGAQVITEGRALIARSLEHVGLSQPEATRVSTRVWATIVGFQVDLLATGDEGRIAVAVEDVCRWLDDLSAPAPA
jgi:AcrR family transcriptional regulator